MKGEDPPRKIGAGVLQAAGRQGVRELGEALKAFPDSISISEPGAMFTPTQGEVAEANRDATGTIWGRVKDAHSRIVAKDRDPPSRDMDRD